MATLTPSIYSFYQNALDTSNRTAYTPPVIPSSGISVSPDTHIARLQPTVNNKGVIKSEFAEAILRSNQITQEKSRIYSPGFQAHL